MRISVIVPTYRRVADLQRCLAALAGQKRPPDEVLLAVRDSDSQTREFIAGRPDTMIRLRVVDVAEPGVVAAMNAALDVADGEIIALTDDDGAPWPDWLQKIEAAFDADPRLGAVGGRDWQYKGGKLDDGAQANPGQMQWWGRVSAGHHHATAGPAREVAVVKGVNSAYRGALLRAIRFDTRMAGGGAQVHWELSLCLTLRRAGWKVVFDPAIAVDHFPAERFDEDQRNTVNLLAQRNAVANETLILLEHCRGLQRLAFVAWAAAVGTRGATGLLQVPRLALEGKKQTGSVWLATCRGRVAGLHAWWTAKAVYAPPPS